MKRVYKKCSGIEGMSAIILTFECKMCKPNQIAADYLKSVDMTRDVIKVFLKKKGLLLESHSYLSISTPYVFQQSPRTLLGNLHYGQKTGNHYWGASKP